MNLRGRLKGLAAAALIAGLLVGLLALGGVGAIFFGFLMDRFNANIIVGVGFALTAVAVALIGQATGGELVSRAERAAILPAHTGETTALFGRLARTRLAVTAALRRGWLSVPASSGRHGCERR